MRVCIEGNIGCGKTSLLDRLAAEFAVVPEPVEAWGTLLDDFYRDPREWGFVFNTRVLLDFSRIVDDKKKKVVVVERSPGACRHVFGQLLYNDGHLTPRAWDLFKRFADDLGWTPDAYIYIHVPPEVCMARIAARNRGAEHGVTLEYLARIEFQYENMMRFSKIPVVRVDGTQTPEEMYKEVHAHLTGIIINNNNANANAPTS
jgi:deoxyadenosine/deoxycytidine kinase